MNEIISKFLLTRDKFMAEMHLIRTKNSDDYNEKYMKIKFDSDDESYFDFVAHYLYY